MTAAPFATRHATPPLENGDHLTRSEFERRYLAMPEGVSAELIAGVVYVRGRVRLREHGQPHAFLAGWLGCYVSKSAGLQHVGSHCTVRLDGESEPQPDLLLLLPPHLGGAAFVDEDDFVTGPPDLVCEIAASSVSIDLHAKLNAYRRNGMREYVVWRTQDGAVDWFVLREGSYEPHPPDADGLFRSTRFPGLWLDPDALVRGDLPRVFAVLDAAAATAEHAAFVKRLATPA